MLNRGEEEWKQKKELIKMSSLLKRLLADKDSNLERDNQNVLCYHYTISQYRVSGCKSNTNFLVVKYF